MAEETKINDGVTTITLGTPMEYNGQTYEEIHLALDDLTGEDSMAVENEIAMRKKGTVIFGALNNDYVMGIAARACKEPIGTDAFLRMKLKDYNKVKEAVRNFLLK